MYTIELKVTDEAGNTACLMSMPGVLAEELILPSHATPAPSLCVAVLAGALSQ